MPSTYSDNLRIELPGIGEQNNTWGTTMNTNLGTLLEQAITGVVSIALSDANYTLSTSNGASDEARNAAVEFTGALTASRNITVPTKDKVYIVYNNTSGSQTLVIKTSGGSGITIPNGKKRILYCDGTNVVDAVTDLPSGTQIGGNTPATLTGSETFTNKTLTSPTINSPTITTPSITTPTITGTLSVGDDVFKIKGSSDATKIAVFEVDGITTGTTRTLTVPDASLTLVGLATTQSLTNKTFDNTTTFETKDTLFTLQDDGDAARKARFQLSSITTANTRVMTVPDSDGTLLYTTGSGASLTGIRKQGLETIWLPAASMLAATTNGAATGTTESTTNKVMNKTFDFDQTTSEIVQFNIAMPKSWNLGTVTFIPYWTAASGAGTVIWALSGVALSDNDAIDTAFGTAVTSTDTLITTLNVHVGPTSAAITISGTPAVGDIVYFKLVRDISDTLTADAKLIGIKLLYTTSASDDT